MRNSRISVLLGILLFMLARSSGSEELLEAGLSLSALLILAGLWVEALTAWRWLRDHNR